ncbi:MAG: 16S rRNA (guanine(527)-N(7))-methyltransferase RsmG [Thermodesulfovibrionia bacterium]
MNAKELLAKGLNELGFACSGEQLNAFMTFLFELKKWNRAYNLTALKTDKDIIIKHFLDSILYLKVISINTVRKTAPPVLSPGIKLADMGTGAGFPAIPIKIISPATDITLVESSRKKTAFLRHIIRVLKLEEVNILNKRVEDLGEDHEKTYDVIVSRATFKVKDFMKKACPYVKENGRLILSKGPKSIEEIKGLKKEGIIKKIIRLPFINIERTLLVIKCEKEP